MACKVLTEQMTEWVPRLALEPAAGTVLICLIQYLLKKKKKPKPFIYFLIVKQPKKCPNLVLMHKIWLLYICMITMTIYSVT